MALTVDNQRLYCTTADEWFGPQFKSDADADHFLAWCRKVHRGDPRTFDKATMKKAHADWALTKIQIDAVARGVADKVLKRLRKCVSWLDANDLATRIEGYAEGIDA